MSTQYAKDQPAGFTNKIEKVAIVGAGGTIGTPILHALLSTNQFSITAITRHSSGSTTSSLPTSPNLKIAYIDPSSPSSLISALRGQDFLITTLAPIAPPDTHSRIVQAAAQAGVKYVMPNGYGPDIDNEQFGKDVLLGPGQKNQRDEIEGLGMKWVGVCCGFWWEYSIGGGEVRMGIDLDERKVTMYDDGETKDSFSTLLQVGRAVARVLSLDALPEDEKDERLTLSNFFNKGVYLKSFVVSQREVFESIKRVTGTSGKDWEVKYEDSKKRYAAGMKQAKEGDMRGFAKLLYARGFWKEDPSNLEGKAMNDVLGLPEEDLDEATRRGVELAEVLKGRGERMAY